MVSNSSRAASISGVALGPGAEAEVLPDRDLLGARALDQDLGCRTPRRRSSENSLVERDHHQLLDPEALDHVALDAKGMISFGAASGWITLSGCGSKVRTVSAPSITSRWPTWTPSKVPIATLRGRAARRRGAG